MSTLQHDIILNGRTKEVEGKEASLTKWLEVCYKQEEIYCKKKSRINWLKEGE